MNDDHATRAVKTLREALQEYGDTLEAFRRGGPSQASTKTRWAGLRTIVSAYKAADAAYTRAALDVFDHFGRLLHDTLKSTTELSRKAAQIQIQQGRTPLEKEFAGAAGELFGAAEATVLGIGRVVQEEAIRKLRPLPEGLASLRSRLWVAYPVYWVSAWATVVSLVFTLGSLVVHFGGYTTVSGRWTVTSALVTFLFLWLSLPRFKKVPAALLAGEGEEALRKEVEENFEEAKRLDRMSVILRDFEETHRPVVERLTAHRYLEAAWAIRHLSEGRPVAGHILKAHVGTIPQLVKILLTVAKLVAAAVKSAGAAHPKNRTPGGGSSPGAS